MANKSTYQWILKLGAEQDGSFSKATDSASKSVDKLGKTAKKSSGLLDGLKGIAETAGFSLGSLTVAGVAGAAVSAVQRLNELVESTAELRTDLSKLNQNALDAGAGLGEVEEHLTDMVALTGESDSSIEGLSNLLAAGYSGNSLTEAVELLSAAVIRFPDTLKIESLADSLQETLATGSATGQFEELLGRLGVNTDEFAANLAKCTTNAERQDLALRTLAGTGLQATLDAYRENNEELLAYNEAAFESELASARLAEAWEPNARGAQEFGTALKNGLAGALNYWNEIEPSIREALLFFYNKGQTGKAESAVTTLTKQQIWLGTINKRIAESFADNVDITEHYNDALGEMETTYGHLSDETRHKIYDTTRELAELEEAYDAAAAAALESVQKQWSAWDNVDYTVTQSAASLTDALYSQTTYWDTYAANLDMIQARGSEELNELVQTMADGSEDSAGYIATLAWATDEQVGEILTAWQAMRDSQTAYSEELAATQMDYDTRVTEMGNTLEALAGKMDQEDNAYQAAKNTLHGFANGITDSGSIVANAYASTLRAAADAISGYDTASVGTVRAGGKTATRIPKLAEGGVVNRPTVALIGEGGEREAVVPLSKLDGLASAGSGMSVTYSPVLNVAAGAQQAQVQVAVEEGFEQFKAYMSRLQREHSRTAFAR